MEKKEGGWLRVPECAVPVVQWWKAFLIPGVRPTSRDDILKCPTEPLRQWATRLALFACGSIADIFIKLAINVLILIPIPFISKVIVLLANTIAVCFVGIVVVIVESKRLLLILFWDDALRAALVVLHGSTFGKMGGLWDIGRRPM